ncbi:MAG: prepilin peptidase [Bacillota bacterium]
MVNVVPAMLAVAGLVSVITDLKTGLIYNWLTLPLWMGGLIMSYFANGWGGVGDALAAGVLITVTTFQFTQFGFGDIKLGLGIGAWIGLAGAPVYIIGAGLTRILFSLIVKAKVYGIKGFFAGLKYEMLTGTIPPTADRNFATFQNAARQAGYEGVTPVVPGAIWAAGGILGYVISRVA